MTRRRYSVLMQGKNVLVTGGTGIVGKRLIEQLCSLGAKIIASKRKEGSGSASLFLHPNVTWIEGDLQDSSFCEKITDGIHMVFHLASSRKNVAEHRKDPGRFMKENIAMSEALTEAIKYQPNIERMLFMSTANIPPDFSIENLLSEKEADGYVMGKAASEILWQDLALERGIPLLIPRPVGVYGEDDRFAEDSNAIPSLIFKANIHKNELKLWGDGTQRRSFVVVDDLIAALFRLIENKVTGVQYIAPPEVVSIKELAMMICDIVNPNLPIVCDVSKPTGQKAFPAFPVHPLLHNFPWTPLREGLKKTYESWKREKA